MKPAVNISIITICFNNLDDLVATIRSVDLQRSTPFEHIIIDGSTKRDIAEFLTTNPQPRYRKWLSEPDKGIADAFNKGIKLAGGNILNMLNAGDKYYDETVLEIISEKFSNDPDLAWLHGKFMIRRGGIWVTIGKSFDPALLYRGMRSLSHQSMFVKSSLHTKYGLYDQTLRNAMDYDFVCRIAAEKFIFIRHPLVVFAPGGTTDRDYLAAMKEGRQVFEKHFGKSFMLHFWQQRLRFLHFLLKGPAGKYLYKIKVWLKLENA